MGLEPGGASWRPSINSASQVNKMDNDGRSAGGGTSYFEQGEAENQELQPSYDEFTLSSSQEEEELSLDISLPNALKEFFNSILEKIKKFFS